MNLQMQEKEKEGQELETGTSPVEELNNATVPTPEQEEAAGIEPTQSDTELEQNLTVSEENPEPVQEPVQEPAPGVYDGEATRTFTQSQVNEIAGKAREEGRNKALKDTFSRYGVNSVEELDDLFGDAQRFVTTQEDLAEKTKAWEEADATRNAELTSVKERVALLESGIDKARYEDAKLILRGKGLEVTTENILQELGTHPEWKTQLSVPFKKAKAEPATQITTLGNNSADNPQPELTERERAMKMFKV